MYLLIGLLKKSFALTKGSNLSQREYETL